MRLTTRLTGKVNEIELSVNDESRRQMPGRVISYPYDTSENDDTSEDEKLSIIIIFDEVTVENTQFMLAINS